LSDVNKNNGVRQRVAGDRFQRFYGFYGFYGFRGFRGAP
jgi:hypothetical protein